MRSARRLLAVLLALGLLAACAGGQEAAPEPTGADANAPAAATAAAAEPARDFTLPTLDGGSVTLSDLQGEWVVINFWATWCAPCVREMQYLQELADTRDLVVLGVNFNEQPEPVARFVEEHGLTFPILLEPDDITLLMYRVRALPRTFVVAPDGSLVHELYGEIVPTSFDGWLDAQGVRLRAS